MNADFLKGLVVRCSWRLTGDRPLCPLIEVSGHLEAVFVGDRVVSALRPAVTMAATPP